MGAPRRGPWPEGAAWLAGVGLALLAGLAGGACSLGFSKFDPVADGGGDDRSVTDGPGQDAPAADDAEGADATSDGSALDAPVEAPVESGGGKQGHEGGK